MRRSALGGRLAASTSSGSATNFFDLKSVGSAVIHIHANADIGPDMELEERYVYRIPCELPDSFERRYDSGYKRSFFAKADDPNPFEDLRKALERDSSIQDDEVVLRADGAEYTKADCLGRGNDWRKSLKPSREYLFAIVASSTSGDRNGRPSLQILSARPTLAESIDRVIDAQVREHGEEEGEAAVAGYGIEICFDRDAEPSRMYTAQYNGRKASGAVREILDGPGVDLARFCGPPDPELMRAAIEESLVVEVQGFESHGVVVEEKPKRKAGGGTKKPVARAGLKKATKRKPVKVVEEETEDATASVDDDDASEATSTEPSAEAVEVTCPKCSASVSVSPDSKSCSECDYQIIPW